MRGAAAVAGVLAALVLGPPGLLALTTPLSWVGNLYVLGTFVLIAGAITAPKRVVRLRGVSRAGLALVVLTAGFRCASAGRGKTVSMTRGEGTSAPLLDRVFPEDDVAVTAARAVVMTGMLPAGDTKDLVPTLKGAFAIMNRAEGSTPSPILFTSLALQGPNASDVIEIEAGDRLEGRVCPRAICTGTDPLSRSAVLFLHGYGGNFTLQCWMIAQAARRAGAATFCPSTRIWGDWWSPAGKAIVLGELARLRVRGFSRVVLAGLSNGGVGACRLAPSLRGQIVGLLLVSGAAPDAAPAGVPVLAVEGTRDTMMSPSVVQKYANGTGASLVLLDGTHFLLIERPEEMTHVMAPWLAARFAK
jgi:predicted esterase